MNFSTWSAPACMKSCFVYRVCMKTITLTDEAYERLKSWKEAPKESFSAVVMKKVPKRGTFGQLNEDFKKLAPLTDEEARVMEETIAWANDWKNVRDPWAEEGERESAEKEGKRDSAK